MVSSRRSVSVAAKKGTILAAMAATGPQTFHLEPFPLDGRAFSERPGAVKGAPLLGAAKRTLDGEDRSKMIEKRERRGEALRKGGVPKWPLSLGASNTSFNV